MPMGVSVVMNVNTMVEILIHYLESGDWRECFQRAVPQRKVNAKPNLQEAFHFRRVVTEEQLLALTPVQLPKFEFKNALDKYCVKQRRKLTFEKEETKGDGKGRFVVRALIDGKVMGEGEGSSMRIAAAYASWRALKACGVLDDDSGEVVSEAGSVCCGESEEY